MPQLPILIYPEPILQTSCHEVNDLSAEVLSFITDLVDTMKASPGVGLAAPQIGRLLRIIAVDVTPKNPGHGLVVLINPLIISRSGDKAVREGCLSVPDYTANIRRATDVSVKGLTPEGKEVIIEASGFEAVAFQHEIDHLDGILFLDKITNMKRDLFKRKIKDIGS